MAARATVVGSGPNGLAAALTLARAGYAVEVLEAAPALGGSTRSAELTLPGFRHDIGSAVHPAALASPFLRAAGITAQIDWLVPEVSYAHPLPHRPAAMAWRDLDRTAEELGRGGRAWRALVAPLVERIGDVVDITGNQLLRWPEHPITTARFGARDLLHGTGTARMPDPAASALLAGVMAHANTRLPSLAAAAAGLLLAAHGHAGGWPLPRGGAQTIADTLARGIRDAGGILATERPVHTLADLDWGDPAAGDLLILATSPRLLLTHPNLPHGYAQALRAYRSGPAVAKIDVALAGPMPWLDARVSQAPTVHLGGTREEILAAENAVARGRVPASPYVLVVQPSVIDATRAPAGRGVLWAYTHVPARARVDPLALIGGQLDRYAPAWREQVLAVHTTAPNDWEAINPAAIGGDVLGGAFTLAQAIRRPVVSRHPWRTPVRGVYLASSATPPGPAVHGMNGWHAARTALGDVRGERVTLEDIFG